MAIRYDKKLNQEINRTIKNFNQKIARLEKENKELLPEKITKQSLKENVYTRQELRRRLKSMQRFSKRGAQDIVTTSGGVKITKYKLNEIKRENRRIKANLTRQINRMQKENPKIFGVKQSVSFAKTGDPTYLNLVARRRALDKNITTINETELKRLENLLIKTGRSKEYSDSMFKDNYYKMLTDLGYYYNFPENKLNMLKNKLDKLDTKTFYKLFSDEKAIQAILTYYKERISNFTGVNPEDIREDVYNLYNNLIDNIDAIIQDYV